MHKRRPWASKARAGFPPLKKGGQGGFLVFQMSEPGNRSKPYPIPQLSLFFWNLRLAAKSGSPLA